MNELIFERNGNEIRIIKDENGEPLFCLSDICKNLEMENPANIKNAILKEFKLPILKIYSFDTGYGIKEFTMITEPQLYFMLMRSDKPKAREFRQWVINEVLPSIRKSGSYSIRQSVSPSLVDRLIQAKDEVIRAKEEVIRAKEEMIRAKDDFIKLQEESFQRKECEKEVKVIQVPKLKEPKLEDAYGDMLYQESKKRPKANNINERYLNNKYKSLIQIIISICELSNQNLHQREIWSHLYRNFVKAYKMHGRINIELLRSKEEYLNFLINNSNYLLQRITRKQPKEPEEFKKLLS